MKHPGRQRPERGEVRQFVPGQVMCDAVTCGDECRTGTTEFLRRQSGVNGSGHGTSLSALRKTSPLLYAETPHFIDGSEHSIFHSVKFGSVDLRRLDVLKKGTSDTTVVGPSTTETHWKKEGT